MNNNIVTIKNRKLLPLALSAVFIIINQPGFATTPSVPIKVYSSGNIESLALLKPNKNTTNSSFEETKSIAERNYSVFNDSYSPYLQIGATRFFNAKSSDGSGAGLDFFVPLLQSPTDMLFTDVRFYDRSGKAFEGNFHFGYRHLTPTLQHLYGIYAAFDRNRSGLGNYFNQITLGTECWLGKLFIGGNFYQPIGKTGKLLDSNIDPRSLRYKEISANMNNIWMTSNNKDEKAMGGVDGMVGYEFMPGLTGYVGGYYFSAKDTDSIYGPKAKLAYDLSLNNGKKILGIFDKVGVETGIQNDKIRGTTWYLSANLRVGLSSDSNNSFQDVSHHMVDLIHRDVDIVSTTSTKSEEIPYKINGEIAKIAEVHDDAEFLAALQNETVHIIAVKGRLDGANVNQELLKKKIPNKKEIIFGNNLNISHNGNTLSVSLPIESNSVPTNAALSQDFLSLLKSMPSIVIKHNDADVSKAVKNWNDKKAQEDAEKVAAELAAAKAEEDRKAAKLAAAKEKAEKEAAKLAATTKAEEDKKAAELAAAKEKTEKEAAKLAANATALIVPPPPLWTRDDNRLIDEISKIESLYHAYIKTTDPIKKERQQLLEEIRGLQSSYQSADLISNGFGIIDENDQNSLEQIKQNINSKIAILNALGKRLISESDTFFTQVDPNKKSALRKLNKFHPDKCQGTGYEKTCSEITTKINGVIADNKITITTIDL